MILSYIRTALLYILLIVSVRLMGKRQVGQMEPAEFVVTMLVANLASIPMQDEGIPLFTGLVPIFTVLGAELVLSALSMKSIHLRKWLCGKPVILVENGKILQENLKRTRITLDELTGHLRLNEVLDISTVQYAILETNGSLSVFLKAGENPATAKEAGIQAKKQTLPVTVIEDGKLMKQNLPLVKKDEKWVQRVLKSKNSSAGETLLLTVDSADRIFWQKKEQKE
jgi:uncharacterized membrane protein YcaP (DUF421 family)